MAFLNETGLARLWEHIQNKLSGKVDIVAGKGLSTNDFTDEDKAKLASIEEGLPEGKAAYQQLVTDGNGETTWEDRLAYTELETVIILPENTYTTAQAQIYADYALIENEVYTITYNGNTYNSSASVHGQYGICLGNLSIVNQGSDTGEPFVLFMLAPNEVGFAVFKDSSSSRTISVTGPTEKNTLVNSKYLPGNLSAGEGFNSAVICGDEYTSATGSFSFAHGFNTAASGYSSFAEGYFSEARGDAGSHAEGDSTIASGESQHAQGKYNIEDTENKYAHIVGNGTAYNDRSNAHTVDWDGNAWFAGTIKVGGTGQDDENAKEIALKSDIDAVSEKIVEPTGAHQQFVSNGEGEATWEERLGYSAIENITFVDGQGGFNTGNNMHMYYYNSIYEMVNGESYEVVIDGQTYTSVAVLDEEDTDYFYLGNLALMGVGNNTGESFLFMTMGPLSSTFTAYIRNTSTTVPSLQITGPLKAIHKIPSEYTHSNLTDGEGHFSTQSYYSTATGDSAVALGNGTKSTSQSSVAIGGYTEANGQYSLSAGYQTKANGDYSVVTGKYNIVDEENKYSNIIGNGDSNSARSNAHTVDWDGVGWFAGGLKVGGTGQDDEATVDILAEIEAVKNNTVESVNSKTGIVILNANDVGAVPASRTVNGKALTGDISLNASDVGAAVAGDITNAISAHNSSETSHTDIRGLISALDTRLTTLANSDDTTLDQMSEVVEYIKDNRDLIDGITTSKVSVSDIIDNLTTSDAKKPLSAKQGVALKAEIDTKVTAESGKGLSTNDYTTAEKNKLSGIAEGAEVNQNAFSSVVIGSTTITADTKTDTLTITVGDNITVTPDSTNDIITISAVDTTYDAITNDEIDAICGQSLEG